MPLKDLLVSPQTLAEASESSSVFRSPPRVRGIDRWLLSRIAGAIGPAPLRLRLWNGDGVSLSPASPVAELQIKDRRTLLRIAWDPDLEFGEAFTRGRVVVEGDLVSFLEALYRSLEASRSRRRMSGRSSFSLGTHTLRGARRSIHHHYDLGNEFYALWLDPEMVYTCAYFPSRSTTLEEAQKAKMDLVCRKLGLRPGDTVVEAGCGWGALARHMARHYDVTVRAFNISKEQLAYARQRVEEEGLADRVELVEKDYRQIDEPADVFVSVGMLEHVGAQNYRALGSVIQRCLNGRRGRGLLHFIGRDYERPLNPWIRRRIFPGAYAPTLTQVVAEVLEPGGFAVQDVENLRLHYAQTLEHWRARFEDAVERVAGNLGEPFVRAWRLYLAGSEAAFTSGSLQLFQVVFGRPADNDVPWTREQWYQEGAGKGRGIL